MLHKSVERLFCIIFHRFIDPIKFLKNPFGLITLVKLCMTFFKRKWQKFHENILPHIHFLPSWATPQSSKWALDPVHLHTSQQC